MVKASEQVAAAPLVDGGETDLHSHAGFVLADGLTTITVGPTAPESPAVGDLWIDTS